MPSQDQFTYQQGDTEAWRKKHIAAMNYLVSIGASIEQIQAWMEANTTFTPQSNPNALSHLNSIRLEPIAGDENNLAATPVPAYTALIDGQWFIATIDQGNTSNTVNLDINGLGAREIRAQDNSAVPLGAMDGVHMLVYRQNGNYFEAVTMPSKTGKLAKQEALVATATGLQTSAAVRSLCANVVYQTANPNHKVSVGVYCAIEMTRASANVFRTVEIQYRREGVDAGFVTLQSINGQVKADGSGSTGITHRFPLAYEGELNAGGADEITFRLVASAFAPVPTTSIQAFAQPTFRLKEYHA